MNKFSSDSSNRDIRVLFPRCNYRCIYCHNEGVLKYDKLDLDFNEIANFIKFANDKYYSKKVYFSGGEPLLSDHFHLLYNKLSNISLSQVVVTNGSMLTSDIIELLSKKNTEIHINIPSFDNDKYIFLTGQSKNKLNNIISNILIAKSNGLKVNINYVVCKNLNTSNRDIKKTLKISRELGVESIRFIEVLPVLWRKDILNLYYPIDVYAKKTVFDDLKKVKNKKSRITSYCHNNGIQIDFIKCSCSLDCASCGMCQ